MDANMTLSDAHNDSVNSSMLTLVDDDVKYFSLYGAAPNLTQADVIVIVTKALVVFVLGVFANVPLLYIYTGSKKLRNEKVFQLTLAAVDMVALFTLLPYSVLQHLIARNVPLMYVAYFLTVVVAHSYHFTISVFTVFRYIAVYLPFRSKTLHNTWSSRVPYIVAGYSVVNGVVNVILDLIEYHNRNPCLIFATLLFNFSQIFLSLFVMVVLFIKIVWKLRGDPMNGSVHSTGQVRTSRRSHLVAVKMFLAITICCFVAYVDSFLVFFGIINWRFGTLYFLNHICNPYIYISLNRSFRTKFCRFYKDIFLKMVSLFRCEHQSLQK